MKLNDLPQVAIILVLVGVFFAIGIVVLGTIQTNNVGVTLNTVTNESITMPQLANGTVTLAHGYLVSITSVKNSTGSAYSSTNYTISNSVNGVVKFVNNQSAACYGGTSCRITYTYNTYGETPASVSLTNTIEALGEIPNNWLILIVVIIVASIVIGVVVSNLGNVGTGRV